MFYGDDAANFCDNEIPKVGFNYTLLAVISIDSVLKKDENYYPQVLFKECKYTEKEKKVIRHITGDLEVSNDHYDESDEG